MKKLTYESVNLEIILLPESDVITTSTPFNGEDDHLTNELFEW
jgi:hypothetical protein